MGTTVPGIASVRQPKPASSTIRANQVATCALSQSSSPNTTGRCSPPQAACSLPAVTVGPPTAPATAGSGALSPRAQRTTSRTCRDLSVTWRHPKRQGDPEGGRAGTRLDAEAAAVTLGNDLLGDVQPETGALTYPLGGEERLEQVGPLTSGDAGSVVADLHGDLPVVGVGAERQHAAAAHRVDGVVDEVGPDLAEF